MKNAIIFSFIFFAAFIGTLVVVCIRQDVNLISKDYYKDELVYQDQIDRLQNTEDLTQKPLISLDHNNQLQITFDQFADVKNGVLILFCPSDPKRDKKFIIAASTKSIQTISTGIAPGMYKARFSWTMGEKEFYTEEVIQL